MTLEETKELLEKRHYKIEEDNALFTVYKNEDYNLAKVHFFVYKANNMKDEFRVELFINYRVASTTMFTAKTKQELSNILTNIDKNLDALEHIISHKIIR